MLRLLENRVQYSTQKPMFFFKYAEGIDFLIIERHVTVTCITTISRNGFNGEGNLGGVIPNVYVHYIRCLCLEKS